MKKQRGIVITKLAVIISVVAILTGATLPGHHKHYQQRAFNDALITIDDIRPVVDVCYNTKKSTNWCHQDSDKAVQQSVADVWRDHRDKIANITVAHAYGEVAIRADTSKAAGNQHIDPIGHAKNGKLIWITNMGTTNCDEVRLCRRRRMAVTD